jgi:hypothetical protein
MNNSGQWAIMLKKLNDADTLKKLREVKDEAKTNSGLNYRQMNSIIERCDYAIGQLENPAKEKLYTPNQYDKKRMDLKGLNKVA